MIYALCHYAPETIGLMAEELESLRLPYQNVLLYNGYPLPKVDSGLTGLIVMGGPMSAEEEDRYAYLAPEMELIKMAVDRGRPVLGICLGAQLIAKALGSKVYPSGFYEVGWHPVRFSPSAGADPLLKGIPNDLTVLHWHGDTFDLPPGAVHLARTDRCKNQAFRWKDNVYGFQFHLEATEPMLREWCASLQQKDFIRQAGEDPGQILKAAPAALARLAPHAKRFFSDYLTQAY